MSKHRFFAWFLAFTFGLWLTAPSIMAADAAGMHLEVVLVWGTNEAKPDDPNLKELDPGLAKKLGRAPYKWKNYFEVRRKEVNVALKSTEKLPMSKHCSLEIRNLGNERLEVKLIGQGKPVSRSVESLPMGHTMILGGDGTNDTAWLIVLRQISAGK